MENSAEKKKYSPEEMAEIQKERILSDAELINNGEAEYKFNEIGQGGLVLAENKIKQIRDTQDKETVLKIVKEFGQDLQYVSPELRANREVVLAAVKQDDLALADASPELRDNEEVVMEAMKSKRWRENDTPNTLGGSTFKNASPRLRGDREFVRAVFMEVPGSLTYASPELKADKKFVFELAEIDRRALFAFNYSSVISDKEIFLKFIEKLGINYFHDASAELKKDKDVVLAVLKRFPDSFEDVPSELQNDRDIRIVAGFK